jgi:hypothetical protein
MRKYKLLILNLAILLLAFIIVKTNFIESALAQTGGSYDLSWSTVDDGGGTTSGGGYTLVGTVAQPDAGSALTGGDYTLTGGFWPGIISGRSSGSSNNVYLPIIMKNS